LRASVSQRVRATLRIPRSAAGGESGSGQAKYGFSAKKKADLTSSRFPAIKQAGKPLGLRNIVDCRFDDLVFPLAPIDHFPFTNPILHDQKHHSSVQHAADVRARLHAPSAERPRP